MSFIVFWWLYQVTLVRHITGADLFPPDESGTHQPNLR